MSKQQTLEDIQQAIRVKYAKVSQSSNGIFSYPTGEKGANFLGYNLFEFTNLPKKLLESFCGVGNPFSLGSIKEGESILDIGCGAGFDLFVASTKVGESGKVCGIDLTPEMVMKAKENLQQASCHVEVQVGSSEAIPFDTDIFDVVTSNGVLNLSPLKEKSFKEIYRVLKPGGQLQFADIILKEKLPEEITGNLDAWSNWIGGAISGRDLVILMEKVGFTQVEFVGETGIATSPYTVGGLIRGKKRESKY